MFCLDSWELISINKYNSKENYSYHLVASFFVEKAFIFCKGIKNI